MKKISIQSVLAFAIVVGYLLIQAITGGSNDNETIRTIVVLVIGYYFGSSDGSAKKTDLMNKKEG